MRINSIDNILNYIRLYFPWIILLKWIYVSTNYISSCINHTRARFLFHRNLVGAVCTLLKKLARGMFLARAFVRHIGNVCDASAKHPSLQHTWTSHTNRTDCFMGNACTRNLGNVRNKTRQRKSTQEIPRVQHSRMDVMDDTVFYGNVSGDEKMKIFKTWNLKL